MSRTVISSPHAPPAIGPYSQGIHTGSFVFLSGQIPLVGGTGKLAEGAIKEQTEQVIANIKALLATQGLDLTDVVKAAQEAGEGTFRVFFFTSIAGLVYLFLSSVSKLVQYYLTKKFSAGVRQVVF